MSAFSIFAPNKPKQQSNFEATFYEPVQTRGESFTNY
jgi:hypothetical protein